MKVATAHSRPQTGSNVLWIRARPRLQRALGWAGKCGSWSGSPSTGDRLATDSDMVGWTPCAVGRGVGTVTEPHCGSRGRVRPLACRSGGRGGSPTKREVGVRNIF